MNLQEVLEYRRSVRVYDEAQKYFFWRDHFYYFRVILRNYLREKFI